MHKNVLPNDRYIYTNNNVHLFIKYLYERLLILLINDIYVKMCAPSTR